MGIRILKTHHNTFSTKLEDLNMSIITHKASASLSAQVAMAVWGLGSALVVGAYQGAKALNANALSMQSKFQTKNAFASGVTGKFEKIDSGLNLMAAQSNLHVQNKFEREEVASGFINGVQSGLKGAVPVSKIQPNTVISPSTFESWSKERVYQTKDSLNQNIELKQFIEQNGYAHLNQKIEFSDALISTMGEAFHKAVIDDRFSVLYENALEDLKEGKAAIRNADFAEADRLIPNAEMKLCYVYEQIVGLVKDGAQIALYRKIIEAVTRIGYQGKGYRDSDTGRAGIAAERDGKMFGILQNADGTVDIDMAGHGDETCEDAFQTLVESLEESGVKLEFNQKIRHDKYEGGDLILRARQSQKPMHQALAEMEEQLHAPRSNEPKRARFQRARQWMYNHQRQHIG